MPLLAKLRVVQWQQPAEPHTRCKLQPHSQDRRHWARAEALYVYVCMCVCIYSSAKGGPPGDSRSSTDALQMVLNPDL